jgi:hypothetical protein
MRLVMRGVGCCRSRVGGSGILSVFREVGYSTGWSGGLPGPMKAVVIRTTILILDSGCKGLRTLLRLLPTTPHRPRAPGRLGAWTGFGSSHSPSRIRHLPDPWVLLQHKLARPQRRRLKVRRVNRQHLPAANLAAKELNRPHLRKLPPQAGMVLLRRRYPDPIVLHLRGLVAQHQDDLFSHIHRKTSKHRMGPRLERRKRIEHKLKRHRPSHLRRNQRILRHKCVLPLARLLHSSQDTTASLSRWFGDAPTYGYRTSY